MKTRQQIEDIFNSDTDDKEQIKEAVRLLADKIDNLNLRTAGSIRLR